MAATVAVAPMAHRLRADAPTLPEAARGAPTGYGSHGSAARAADQTESWVTVRVSPS